MQNSGNEAKKYLKTKNITFLSNANYAHFACKLTAIGREKQQRQRFLRKRTEACELQGKARTVTSSRLHELRACMTPSTTG
jgi:hypothetical protein